LHYGTWDRLPDKHAGDVQLSELRGQHRSLKEEERRLTVELLRLQAKIDAQRSRSEPSPQSQLPYLTCYDAWYVALAEFLGREAGHARREARPRAGHALRLLPAAALSRLRAPDAQAAGVIATCPGGFRYGLWVIARARAGRPGQS
jgi:hypothetical protein